MTSQCNLIQIDTVKKVGKLKTVKIVSVVKVCKHPWSKGR